MRNLLGTHLGHSGVYTMCNLLEDRYCPSSINCNILYIHCKAYIHVIPLSPNNCYLPSPCKVTFAERFDSTFTSNGEFMLLVKTSYGLAFKTRKQSCKHSRPSENVRIKLVDVRRSRNWGRKWSLGKINAETLPQINKMIYNFFVLFIQ